MQFNKLSKPYFLQIGFYFFIFISLFACQKQVEGCTQPIASNYQADADKDCCCTFYNLELSLKHLAADSLSFFSINAPFELNSGQIITPLSFNLLISDIQLYNRNNQNFSINDSSAYLLTNGISNDLANDFTLFSPNIFSASIGKFTQLDTFNRLSFTVGLDNRLSQISPAAITDANNPLSFLASPLLYNSAAARYNTAVFRFAVSNSTDTVTFAFPTNVRIELPCNVAAVDGRNTRINLNIYYATLFDNINFQTHTADTIKARFERNLNQSFQVQ
jgi:hypothetical protein